MLARALSRLVEAQAGWARPWGKLLQRVSGALLGPVPRLKDALNGTWLGHSLHAAITDVPIGALTLMVVLDLAGQAAAADLALGLGILAMLAAAVSGSADHLDTVGRERVVTTVHATLMLVALVLFVVSLLLRIGGGPDRALPIVIGLVGYAVMIAGAWIGGEAVYGLGITVDRHAWLGGGERDWHPLGVGDVPEGSPARAMVGDTPLVIVRSGERISALHETCAHAGGPLSEGRVVDGAIECPWHGSCFDLATGHRRQGPSTHDQPAFEVRGADGGGYEVRRLSS